MFDKKINQKKFLDICMSIWYTMLHNNPFFPIIFISITFQIMIIIEYGHKEHFCKFIILYYRRPL